MIKAIGSKKDLSKEVYYTYVFDIIQSQEVQQLKQYTHHICTTRFQHCINVSYYSYRVCHIFGLNEKAVARAGLLHDLYYYDTHNRPSKVHLKNHPMTALQNASERFSLSLMEKDIISKHMFPITKELPKYKETVVIVVIDKYCAIIEPLLFRLNKIGSIVKQKRLKHSIKK